MAMVHRQRYTAALLPFAERRFSEYSCKEECRMFTEPDPIRHPGSEDPQTNLLFVCSCGLNRVLRKSILSAEVAVSQYTVVCCASSTITY